MHYCVHLLTKELPSENKIAAIMNPYNQNLYMAQMKKINRLIIQFLHGITIESVEGIRLN